MKAEFINPFIVTTIDVFSKMMSCQLTNVGLRLKEGIHPEHEVSGIIGLTGRAAGTVVLNLSREVALGAAGALMGQPQEELNGDVADCIGELANMVAGGAKAQLAELDMRISLPSVIIGQNHMIMSNSKVRPISVQFKCKWGLLNVDVSLVEQAL